MCESLVRAHAVHMLFLLCLFTLVLCRVDLTSPKIMVQLNLTFITMESCAHYSNAMFTCNREMRVVMGQDFLEYLHVTLKQCGR